MKKEKILLIVALILVAIFIIVFAYQQSSKKVEEPSGIIPSTGTEQEEEGEMSEEAKEASRKILEESTQKEGGEVRTIKVTEEGEDGEIIEREIQTTILLPGTSNIDLETGKVVNEQGKVVDNTAKSGSQAAPQQSFPVEADDLPESTTRIEMTMNSVNPAEFTVERGQLVNLALINANTNTFSVRLRFDDPSLKAVVVGCAKGETKTISFNAPTQAGEYVYYNDMFDHRDRGAEGIMIVR
jgi:hypothetical protein